MDTIKQYLPTITALISTALSSGWVGLIALVLTALFSIGAVFGIGFILDKIKRDAANKETERKRVEAVTEAPVKNREQERDALDAISKTDQMAKEARRKLEGGS
jgi:hypothetical protein